MIKHNPDLSIAYNELMKEKEKLGMSTKKPDINSIFGGDKKDEKLHSKGKDIRRF